MPANSFVPGWRPIPNNLVGVDQHPTDPKGPLLHAMLRITCNPTSARQNMGEDPNFSREMFEQLQMALTIQMGLNGPQQIKRRALHNVLTSKAARGDMRQVLQSRAEIYGDELDPNWFKQKGDLGGKTSLLKEKNQARCQLAGAPLLVAQVGDLEFRKRMMTGDINAIKGLHLGSQMTVAELLKTLGKLPPLSFISLCNKELGSFVRDHLLQHGEDLDFVQDVLSATGGNLELNPILNSVLAGFSRRKTYGRFKCGQLNLDFDRLRYANTITPKDSDLLAKEVTQNQKVTPSSSAGKGICKFFQQPMGCRFGSTASFHTGA